MPDRRHGKGTERKEFTQPECDRTPEKGLRAEQQPINSPNKLSWERWDLDFPTLRINYTGPQAPTPAAATAAQCWSVVVRRPGQGLWLLLKTQKPWLLQDPPGRQRDKVHLNTPAPSMNARDLDQSNRAPSGRALRSVKRGRRFGTAVTEQMIPLYTLSFTGTNLASTPGSGQPPRKPARWKQLPSRTLAPHCSNSRISGRHGGRLTNHLFGSWELKPQLVPPLRLSDLKKIKRVISTSKLGPTNSWLCGRAGSKMVKTASQRSQPLSL